MYSKTKSTNYMERRMAHERIEEEYKQRYLGMLFDGLQRSAYISMVTDEVKGAWNVKERRTGKQKDLAELAAALRIEYAADKYGKYVADRDAACVADRDGEKLCRYKDASGEPLINISFADSFKQLAIFALCHESAKNVFFSKDYRDLVEEWQSGRI